MRSKRVIISTIIGLIFIIIFSLIFSPFFKLEVKEDNSYNEDKKEEIPNNILEIDAQGNCTYIVDGDTFDIDEIGRIRLADIDAPEVGKDGYQEAKDKTIELANSKIVYLDIDDMGSTSYGRIIAVAYIQYNNTHLLNINKYLWQYGYAEMIDFSNNEFNPYNWNLYEYYIE